jgi:very-short-patch-repair endonuclease
MVMPKGRRGKTVSKTIEAARLLRRRQTPAEKKLWAALRDRQLIKLKFRRQHPYGKFILDAFCVEYQLEVEVDGDWHNTAEQVAYDLGRSSYWQQRAVTVLRFSNDEVLGDLTDVLKRIVEATQK